MDKHIDLLNILKKRLNKLLTREQNYKENMHKCLFDRDFLEMCLLRCGFDQIESWDPISLNFRKDASYDELSDSQTSLNLMARKKI